MKLFFAIGKNLSKSHNYIIILNQNIYDENLGHPLLYLLIDGIVVNFEWIVQMSMQIFEPYITPVNAGDAGNQFFLISQYRVGQK